MTALPLNDRYVSLSPVAGTTQLDYDFPLTRQDGLRIQRDRADVTTTLTLGVNYSFPDGLGNDAGGHAVLAAPSLAGDVYQLIGLHPEDRLSEYQASQQFKSDKQNADFDALTLMAQEHRRDIGRSLKLGYGAAPLPEGHFPKADAAGGMVDGGSAADIADAQEHAATVTQIYNQMLALSPLAFPLDRIALGLLPNVLTRAYFEQTLWHRTTGDFSGDMADDPTQIDHVPIDGVPTTVAIWRREYDTELPAWRIGIVGADNDDPGGPPDESDAIDDALAFAVKFRRILRFGARTYGFANTLSLGWEGLELRGSGRGEQSLVQGGTVLKWLGALDAKMIETSPAARRGRVADMLIDGNLLGGYGIYGSLSTPKLTLQNVTVTRTTLAGFYCSTFSWFIENCSAVNNEGDGWLFERAQGTPSNLNDQNVFGGTASGNKKNGVNINPAGAAHGFKFFGFNCENNALAGTQATPYAAWKIGTHVKGIIATGGYVEMSSSNAEHEYQLAVDIADGARYDLGFTFIATGSATSARKLRYLIKAGGGSQGVLRSGIWSGPQVAAINNQLNGNGWMEVEDTFLKHNASGFQSDQVDFAGAPTQAGLNLIAQTGYHYARMSMSATQVISSATPADVQFNTVISDPASLFDAANFRVVFKLSGRYEIDVPVQASAYTASTSEQLRLQAVLNSSAVRLTRHALAAGPGNDSPVFRLKAVVDVLAGDTLRIQASRVTASITVGNTSSLTYFEVRYVGLRRP